MATRSEEDSEDSFGTPPRFPFALRRTDSPNWADSNNSEEESSSRPERSQQGRFPFLDLDQMDGLDRIFDRTLPPVSEDEEDDDEDLDEQLRRLQERSWLR